MTGNNPHPAELVRGARTLARQTQRQLGERVADITGDPGWDGNRIAAIENKRRALKVEDLPALAEAQGVDTTFYLGMGEEAAVVSRFLQTGPYLPRPMLIADSFVAGTHNPTKCDGWCGLDAVLRFPDSGDFCIGCARKVGLLVTPDRHTPGLELVVDHQPPPADEADDIAA